MEETVSTRACAKAAANSGGGGGGHKCLKHLNWRGIQVVICVQCVSLIRK